MGVTLGTGVTLESFHAVGKEQMAVCFLTPIYTSLKIKKKPLMGVTLGTGVTLESFHAVGKEP